MPKLDWIFDAADHQSGAATDGQVLTADGATGAAWEAVTGDKVLVAGGTDATNRSSTSESYTDQTNITATVVTTVTCTLLINAGCVAVTSDNTVVVAIHNGTTQVDAKEASINNVPEGLSWGFLVTGQVAGTYTYKMQKKRVGGAGTTQVRSAWITITAIPE